MKRNFIAIEFRDVMTLFVVWELHDSCWEILSIVRLRCAIATTLSSPTTRLIFPTGVLPNGVWGGVCKKQSARTNHLKADLLPKSKDLVLALLKDSPGQTKDSITERLGISNSTVLQLLRKLEKEGAIHQRPHPIKNRTKLYYTASSAPTNTGRGATSNSIKPARSTPSSPPLKVYFVDPKTLQSLNR